MLDFSHIKEPRKHLTFYILGSVFMVHNVLSSV